MARTTPQQESSAMMMVSLDKRAPNTGSYQITPTCPVYYQKASSPAPNHIVLLKPSHYRDTGSSQQVAAAREFMPGTQNKVEDPCEDCRCQSNWCPPKHSAINLENSSSLEVYVIYLARIACTRCDTIQAASSPTAHIVNLRTRATTSCTR